MLLVGSVRSVMWGYVSHTLPPHPKVFRHHRQCASFVLITLQNEDTQDTQHQTSGSRSCCLRVQFIRLPQSVLGAIVIHFRLFCPGLATCSRAITDEDRY